MRCYAPRAGTILFFVVLGAVALHGQVGQAVATVGLVTAILAASALVAGILTGSAFAVRAVQRRRAAVGACTTCRFNCQLSLTQLTRHGTRPASRRPVFVGIYTRQEEPRWPERALPLTALVAPAGPPSGTDETSLTLSGDLDAGAAQDHDRARADGELVAS